MAKKPAPDTRNKRNKIKYKEMFTELATHQEQLVLHNPSQPLPPPKRVMSIDSEDEVELEVLQHDNTDLDRVCETVHRLLAKNKVSAKNAFEVPMIDLQQLPDFAGDFLQNEHAWKRLSSTLESDYKIYGYRVDAIHSITYNILNAMIRKQQDAEQIKVEPEKQANAAQFQVMKIAEGVQSEHLEKKLQNISFNALELAVRMDPVLERTRRQFDQLSPESMLLNTLPIDDQLTLRLIDKDNYLVKYPPWGQYSGPWKTQDPLMVLTELNMFRSGFEQRQLGLIQEEGVEQWFDQKQNYCNNYSLMDMQDLFTDNKKAISKQIKFKHKLLRTERDLMEDADNWMGDLTKRAMGMKTTVKIQALMKAEPREQDPTTYVDFSLNQGQEQDTRNTIFRKDPDKNEFHEQIEDRFLLANKLQTSFSLSQHLLTMEDDVGIPEAIAMQPDIQVDVRRQQISIMQSKRRMRDLLHERSTFQSLYEGYGLSQNISPALCFLTVLHLANEYGLAFQQFGDSNFHIR